MELLHEPFCKWHRYVYSLQRASKNNRVTTKDVDSKSRHFFCPQ